MRAEPYYCPYCGEQELVPSEEAGANFCGCCNRHFTVRFLGLGSASQRSEPGR
jgi:hypothetical protein